MGRSIMEKRWPDHVENGIHYALGTVRGFCDGGPA